MKNNYKVIGEVVHVSLANRTEVMLADLSDLETLKSIQATISYSNGYAIAKEKGKHIRVHRLLMNFPEKQVDHINANRLDNRRENLRVVTNKENAMNLNNKYPVGRSGVKGVAYVKGDRKKHWNVRIRKQSYGYYNTVEEAEKVALKVYEELKGVV